MLGYSDSFYLAALIWAVLAVERRHWWLAGILAACATASRPNGVIAVAAVLAIAITMRAGIRQIAALVVPSALVLLGWTVFLREATGDPLVFWSAKAGWDELTLVEFLTDVADQPLALFHIAWFTFFAIAYATGVRRQPPAWMVIVILGVVPALALGVIGLARYSVLAFPMTFAVADVLANRPRWIVVSLLSTSAITTVIFARLVVVASWIP